MESLNHLDFICLISDLLPLVSNRLVFGESKFTNGGPTMQDMTIFNKLGIEKL